MYASTLRQSLATFNARLGKQAQTLPAAARRSGGDALRPGYNNFSSSLRNRTARAMTTMTAAMMMRGLWTSSRAIGVTPLSVRVGSNSQRASSGSVRWNSGKGEPSWRQWGFEDINASLPSETAGSPPQTPQKNLILVDVREPAELTSTGIIPTAVAVPLASQPDALFLTPEEFETRFGYPKPGAGEDEAGDVVFYCKAGVRARAAAQLAMQAGYDPERVGVYDGSWLDWAKNGGRVEKWEGEDYE